MRTDVEGEYQNWRECLHLQKICASPEKTCHPKGQAMRSTEPGASNLLSLSGIRHRESRSIRLNRKASDVRSGRDTHTRSPPDEVKIQEITTRMRQIKGARPMRTDVEGEYQNWRECLHLQKICASPEKTCHPKGQAMRSTEPGASNLLSLSGIRHRESRSIRLN